MISRGTRLLIGLTALFVAALGTFDGARYTAAHISQARFVGYRDGGHVWVGHQSDVMAQVAEFLSGDRRGPISAIRSDRVVSRINFRIF